MTARLAFACLLTGVLMGLAGAAPLQTFTVKDYLNHRWQDELVHFDFDVATDATQLALADENGNQVPCQFSDLSRQGDRTRGTVWTVVTVEPKGQVTLHLQPASEPAASQLRLEEGDAQWVLRNSRMAVAVGRLPQELKEPVPLTKLPALVLWVAAPSGEPLGQGRWVNDGPPLLVKQAATRVLENGPVLIRVEQALTFADGNTYQATVTLAARQETALITEHTSVDAPKAAFRFSFVPGLNADHVFWHNQWRKTQNAESWSRANTALTFAKERRVCRLRPWSFWWLGDITEWAGFYRQGAEPLVGLIALRPSRWSPDQWGGFDRTEIPVIEGPGPRLDVTLALLATEKKSQAGPARLVPLHREWAITVGKVSEHVSLEGTAKLRRQLIKYSEFPLDEVKNYGFEFKPARPDRQHPFLLFTREDVERVRRQAAKIPVFRKQLAEALRYTVSCSGKTLEQEGAQAYYKKHYMGNYLVEKLPEAYLGSDDPRLGRWLAAAVQGLTKSLLDGLLEAPDRPAIGAYGPWRSESVMRLLLNYDLVAGTGEQEAAACSALVFGAHFLAHPDYWNTAHGLCSANPNMTSSILLPRGMTALFLAGHPQADEWLTEAEQELKRELQHWISPGGAWVENPGYQAASLDGMFLLAQAIRNVLGRDYFADPNFKATMDYYGFILTPPDLRFPPKKPDSPHPMTQPSIGDMFSGFITCFNGWMAKATAQTDPAYSARQQFYWKMQNFYLGSAGRAKGFTMALTDPDLPATPPAELSRAFPGFGSIMRTSWTDPKASYVAHRTGPNLHHYHADYNSIVYHAKGVPLCIDFGNYGPVHRMESWYHSQVSPGKGNSGRGELVETRFLPRTADYSCGKSQMGSHWDHRHVLLVKSEDPLGANYVVMRDSIAGPKSDTEFWWNLWCLSAKPSIAGQTIHFPGQFGVDLDVYLLSPAAPDIQTDHWQWEQHIYVWGPFTEEQYGVHVVKKGPDEDYFTVLYPRAEGQGEATVAILADGAGVRIDHMEGTDYVLFSPGRAGSMSSDGVELSGELALARRYNDGTIRLVLIKGAGCAAGLGEWKLSSDAQVAIEIRGKNVTGESNGQAHVATIMLPAGYGTCQVLRDRRPAQVKRLGRAIVMSLPEGYHSFTITPR